MKRQTACLLVGRSQLSCGVVKGHECYNAGGVGRVPICQNVRILQLSEFLLLLALKWQKESNCSSIPLKPVLQQRWKLCHPGGKRTWGHCFSAAVRCHSPALPLHSVSWTTFCAQHLQGRTFFTELSCAVLCLVAQSCPTLCYLIGCSPPGSSVHGDSPGKNTEVGCHALLQGIFPTQELNSGLPRCRQILYHLSHKESPEILVWVAYPFSGELPNPAIALGSPAWQVDSLPAEPPGKPADLSYFFLSGEFLAGYFTGKTSYFLCKVDAEMVIVVQEVFWFAFPPTV